MIQPRDEIPFSKVLSAIVVAHAALTLPFLALTTLWGIDEGRIAEVSREMALSGDFITPRMGEIPFACYPPLPYWLMAASGSVFGWNEFAMRLPAALCGIGLVAFLGLATRRLAGEKAGLAAAGALATLPGFLWQESTCRADVLTLFLAVTALERFLAWGEADEKERRRRDLALMYLLASLGVLAKGPIAIAVLGLGGLAWFAVRRRWNLLPKMGFTWGIPLSIAVILPWYLLVARAAGTSFLRENLLLENVNAFTRGYQHESPWHFYLKAAPVAMFPWLLALGFSWKVRRARGLAFALAWMAGVLLFFTVSSAKRQSYMTYFDPPLAMAAGITLAALEEEAPGLFKKSLMGFGGILLAGGGTLFLIPSTVWTSDRLWIIVGLMPLLAALSAAAGIALAGIAWRRGALAGAVALAAILVGGFTFFRVAIAPRWDLEGREMRDFCRRAAGAVPPGARIGYLKTAQIDGAVHFYMGGPLQPRSGEPGYYILTHWQPRELEDRGRKLRRLDSVKDARKRDTLLVEVTE